MYGSLEMPLRRVRKLVLLLDKHCFLKKKGMLGYFIIPFFALGLFLGLVGLAIFAYVFLRRIIANFLLTRYSIEVGVPLLTVGDFFITPSILNYFGIILFALFLFFNIFVLAVMKDELFEKQSFFNLIFYMLIYLLIYPVTLIPATVHVARGKKVWG